MIHKNFSLKSYNSFGLDYRTDYFISVKSESEALQVLGKGDFIRKQVLVLAVLVTSVQYLVAVAGLPLLQREVIVLSCVEGLPQQEVAAILEIPVNSVKANLRRARLALAKVLLRRQVASAREVGP